MKTPTIMFMLRSWLLRVRSLGLAAVLCAVSMPACGTGGKSAPPPPVDDYQRGRTEAPTQNSGMSTRKKVVLLAGAAALYYMYKQHQKSAQQDGPDGQYYLSKNGRVYYRDAEHRAHWVSPPAEGISVPAAQADEYRDFQGYERQTTGRDLSGLEAAAE